MNFEAGVLKVTCLGEHGVGSAGQPSANLVTSTIERWIESHPDKSVTQIEVDYTKVDYSWGDGPVSSLVGFYRQGVPRFRLVAGPNNVGPLEALVKGCNISFFEVVNERQS